MCKYAHARGVWGYAPPGKFCRLDALIASEATFGPKRHYSYHCETRHSYAGLRDSKLVGLGNGYAISSCNDVIL